MEQKNNVEALIVIKAFERAMHNGREFWIAHIEPIALSDEEVAIILKATSLKVVIQEVS